MNRLQVIFGVVIILVIIAIGAVLYKKIPKTAYVNTEQVYNEFKLKKELELKLKKDQDIKNALLDSLSQELQILSEDLDMTKTTKGEKVSRFNVLRRSYLMKKEEFERQNQELSSQYSDQVWKQLNQFIKEYGEKHSYDYVYGAHGQGNLMYANESENITAKVQEYVNGRYEGDIK